MSNIWGNKKIFINNNEEVQAITPLILSASRVTDIAAFYSDWFFNCLKNGFFKWINPFNGKVQYVSTDKVRLIVFWSKYPEPIIPYLKILNEKGINYYFHFTLNDYEKENLEPDLPELNKRIEIFKLLSSLIGKEKVIWRFDPLVLFSEKFIFNSNFNSINKMNNQLSYIDNLIEKIYNIGQNIVEYTDRLVISFVDILQYKKVERKFKKYYDKYLERNSGEKYKKLKQDFNKNENNDYNFEFDFNQKVEFAKKLDEIRKVLINKNNDFKIYSCCENIDLSIYNIQHNKCIDDLLIKKLFFSDQVLMDFLNATRNLKDKGQRKDCGCIVSKDIGLYNSCKFHCVYCYSNK